MTSGTSCICIYLSWSEAIYSSWNISFGGKVVACFECCPFLSDVLIYLLFWPSNLAVRIYRSSLPIARTKIIRSDNLNTYTDNILPSWRLNLFIFIFNIFLKYKFIILFKYVLLFWKTMRLNLNEKRNYFILICSYDVYVICWKSFISFKIKYIVTEFSNLRKKLRVESMFDIIQAVSNKKYERIKTSIKDIYNTY